MLSIEELKSRDCIIFEALSGSQSFGLATENSDTDIKGVFIAPPDVFFGFTGLDQVNDEKNDVVYFELKKFLHLLSRNNPSALEMLYTPQPYVNFENQLFGEIRKQQFLSKVCLNTFANYAFGQVKKANGLNKKISNPMPKERRGILDFCYVAENAGTLKLQEWLAKQKLDTSRCGLTKLPNFRDVFAVFYNDETSSSSEMQGFTRSTDATDLCLSSIKKGLKPIAYLHFNRESFAAHCDQHREYWEWVTKRSPERYATNVAHNKNYDSKNMQHVFRLLAIAKMIAEDSTIDFSRLDRNFLLRVKAGAFEYDDLVARAEALVAELAPLYHASSLPDAPDIASIERMHTKLRIQAYCPSK